MNPKEMTVQTAGRYWVGIDWGRQRHAVAVANDGREIVKEFTVCARCDGLNALSGALRALGAVGGIAVEAARDPLVDYLMNEGFVVYPINPKLSKNWRACNSVAEVKSDAGDGRVLALELSRRHESLRALEREVRETAELASQCEQLRALIHERTSLVQRLRETLRKYHPQALAFFGDWTSLAAWQFVKRFPRPEALNTASKATLIRFLKAHRIGLKPVWLARIEQALQGDWVSTPQAAGLEIEALATAAQLMALQPYIDGLDKRIQQRTGKMPAASVIRSLPGVGKRLAPALLSITTSARAKCGGYEVVRLLGGVAPVFRESGKRRSIQLRRRCNKYWRNTFHLFAFCSLRQCAWAKAFYDQCRAHGDRHATALRKLADKWLRILMRMLQTGEPYDDKRYVESLRKNNSPLYAQLSTEAGG